MYTPDEIRQQVEDITDPVHMSRREAFEFLSELVDQLAQVRDDAEFEDALQVLDDD